MKNALSVSLVIMQMALIVLLTLGIHFHVYSWGMPIMLLSLLLGIWSIIAMSKSRLNIMPEPLKDAHLITSGPYKLIRHPMYTAVVSFAVGALLTNPDKLRGITTLLLIAVLIVKLNHEEKMLLTKFPEYKTYMSSTYRLIPYLF